MVCNASLILFCVVCPKYDFLYVIRIGYSEE